MKEITAHIDGEKEIDKIKFELQMQLHCLKKHDIMQSLETKRQHQDAYLNRIETKTKEKVK